MKIGLISDVHADIDALDRTLAHLASFGVDKTFCAGDIVGYGAKPAETVARLGELSIPAVRGNHDRWALERGAALIDPFGIGPLSQSTLQGLRDLPPMRVAQVSGQLMIVTHGTPGNDMEYLTRQRFKAEELRGMLCDIEADILVVGHTHEPMCFSCDRGMIVNPGSIYSSPSRLRSSRTFAILDTLSKEVRFHDVETGNTVPIEVWEC